MNFTRHPDLAATVLISEDLYVDANPSMIRWEEAMRFNNALTANDGRVSAPTSKLARGTLPGTCTLGDMFMTLQW